MLTSDYCRTVHGFPLPASLTGSLGRENGAVPPSSPFFGDGGVGGRAGASIGAGAGALACLRPWPPSGGGHAGLGWWWWWWRWAGLGLPNSQWEES